MVEQLVERPDLRVVRLAPEAQLLLHGRPQDIARLADMGALALGEQMLRVSVTGDWNALHLSPDEWLLIGPIGDRDAVTARFANAATPKSLVDISERSLGIGLSGAEASMLLNTGCPLDLSDASFPSGSCTRTLFGKVPVLIWRTPHTGDYRMHYGRSFDEYVTTYIRTAAQDVPLSPMMAN